MTSIKVLRMACVLFVGMAIFNCSDSGGGKEETPDDIGKTDDGHDVRAFQKGSLDSILTRVDTTAITGTSFSGTLIFENMKPDEIPNVGDIISSAGTKNAKYGFLYKVLSVSTTDGVTAVVVRNASLEEAIKDVDFKGEAEFDFDEDGNVLEVRQKIYPAANSIDLLPLSVKSEIELKYKKVTGSISTEVKKRAKLNFDMKIKDHKIHNLKMSISQDEEYTLEGKVGGKIDFDTLYTIGKELEFETEFLLGGVLPVVFVHELKQGIKIAGSAELNITSKYILEGNSEYGFKYENGKIQQIKERHLSPTYSIEQCNGGNLRIGVMAEFTSKLYGVAGLSFEAGPALDLSIGLMPIGMYFYDKGFSAIAEATAGLSWGFYLGMEPELEVFGKSLISKALIDSWSKEVFIEWGVLEKTSALPRFTNPNVTKTATGIKVEAEITRKFLNYPVHTYGFCIEKVAGECKDGKGNRRNIPAPMSYGEKRTVNLSFDGLEEGTTYRIIPYFENGLGGTYYDKATDYKYAMELSSSSSVKASSSSVIPSSSSVKASSSSVIPSNSGETVVIGTQTWMARNLNYDVAGSKCYDDDPANCAKYGRLYDWATAMALPSSCNTSSCASQVSAKHQGICPNGWHIPSNADWNVLMKYVNPSCSDNSNCAGAGTKLKATSGWNSSSDVPLGTDNYGFSALPGGIGSYGSFSSVGFAGYWWSSTEDSNYAYLRYMNFGGERVDYNYIYKDFFLSVRCLQD